MRKFIVASLVIATFGISNNAWANTTPDKPTGLITASSAATMPASIINNISVPYEVLTYAQLQYEGSAVTQVSKIVRDGKEFYRLRVDKDDIPDDYSSIYLIYDMKWLLVGDEKSSAPATRKTAPAPAPTPTPQPPAETAPAPTEQQPSGGSGGGSGPSEEPGANTPDPGPSEPEEPATAEPSSSPNP